MRAQNVLPAGAVLEESNAVIFLLRPASPPPGDAGPMQLLLSLVLVLAVLLRILQNRMS